MKPSELRDGDAGERVDATFAIAGAAVTLSAPAAIASLVENIFGGVPRASPANPGAHVAVEAQAHGWNLHARSAGRRFVPEMPLPQLAGLACDLLIAEAAALAGRTAPRGAVLAKGGRGLILCGEEGDDATLLAMHLSARNWDVVSAGHALIDEGSRSAAPLRRRFSLSSASLGAVPRAYKRAVEDSPWYSLRDGLHFYAIDSEDARAHARWTGETRCAALLLLDGSASAAVAPEPAPQPDGAPHIVRGRIGVDHPVAACNAIEDWWERSAGGP